MVDLEAMTWAEFQELFMGKYFLDTARHAKAQEFLELKQGVMTMIEYVARFSLLTIMWPQTWPRSGDLRMDSDCPFEAGL